VRHIIQYYYCRVLCALLLKSCVVCGYDGRPLTGDDPTENLILLEFIWQRTVSEYTTSCVHCRPRRCLNYASSHTHTRTHLSSVHNSVYLTLGIHIVVLWETTKNQFFKCENRLNVVQKRVFYISLRYSTVQYSIRVYDYQWRTPEGSRAEVTTTPDFFGGWTPWP